MLKTFLLNLKLFLLYSSSHKLRTFLTTLGLIIGIGSLVLIVSLGNSAQKSIAVQMQKLGTNLITILPGGSEEGKPASQLFSSQEITTLKYEDAQALKDTPGIVALTAYVRGTVVLNYLNKTKNVLFSGVEPEYLLVENTQIEKGRFFNEDENESMAKVVVLGWQIAKDLFQRSDPLGKKIKINNQNFKIIGVMKKRGKIMFFDYDKEIFLPLKTAQKIILGIDHINFIRAKAVNEKLIPLISTYFKKTLRYRHRITEAKKDDFTIKDSQQMLDIFYKTTNTLKLFLAIIASVSLLVGGIGIANVMYVIVDERIREIGLRKAVGAKNSDILYQFLLESIILTLIGGVIGIFLGILAEFLISVIANRFGLLWPFIISWPSIFISLFVSFLIGLFFGFLPARKASQFSPAQAMRYE